MNDTHLPITGICLITRPNSVPTGYHCIRKVSDESNRDADLMADSFLERKDRFCCITRIWPSPGGRSGVLEDIKLINERDNPPPNYTPLSQTYDTNEKGTSKKIICVKMVTAQAGMKCICDLIFLYRPKRPPPFYTMVGEINGLTLCVKEGTVPPFTALPSAQDNEGNLYPNPITGQHHQPIQHRQSIDYSNTNTLSKKADEKEYLDGIPFEINSKYLNLMRNNRPGNGLSGLDSFRILTPYEIEQYFNYDFATEHSSM